MKKLIAVLMAALICLSFSACGGGETTPDASSSEIESKAPLTEVNIAELASTGALPEQDVGLGSIMGDVRAKYAGNDSLTFQDKNGLYILSCENNTYFMNKSNFGVIGLLTENVAYGIKKTATKAEIKEHIGEPSKEFTPDGTIDVYGNLEGTKSAVSYIFGDFTLSFYFVSDTLHSTLIYKTDSLTEYSGT